MVWLGTHLWCDTASAFVGRCGGNFGGAVAGVLCQHPFTQMVRGVPHWAPLRAPMLGVLCTLLVIPGSSVTMPAPAAHPYPQAWGRLHAATGIVSDVGDGLCGGSWAGQRACLARSMDDDDRLLALHPPFLAAFGSSAGGAPGVVKSVPSRGARRGRRVMDDSTFAAAFQWRQLQCLNNIHTSLLGKRGTNLH